jgi:predicted nucleic acid-binding protein
MPERCGDASVAVKWVVKAETWRKKARRFLRDSLQAGQTLIAPPLFVYETESVLQERLYSKAMTEGEVDTALTRLTALGVQLVTHPDMVTRARAMARQFNQPKIYDSLYAALAELYGCEFWTADRRFYEAVNAPYPSCQENSALPSDSCTHCDDERFTSRSTSARQ